MNKLLQWFSDFLPNNQGFRNDCNPQKNKAINKWVELNPLELNWSCEAAQNQRPSVRGNPLLQAGKMMLDVGRASRNNGHSNNIDNVHRFKAKFSAQQ